MEGAGRGADLEVVVGGDARGLPPRLRTPRARPVASAGDASIRMGVGQEAYLGLPVHLQHVIGEGFPEYQLLLGQPGLLMGRTRGGSSGATLLAVAKGH
jgi:hypothetical protein